MSVWTKPPKLDLFLLANEAACKRAKTLTRTFRTRELSVSVFVIELFQGNVVRVNFATHF